MELDNVKGYIDKMAVARNTEIICGRSNSKIDNSCTVRFWSVFKSTLSF